MKDSAAGWLALGDHLIDRTAEAANRALNDDRIWIVLIVLIALATAAVGFVQIAQ